MELSGSPLVLTFDPSPPPSAADDDDDVSMINFSFASSSVISKSNIRPLYPCGIDLGR
jgi:hypothetical protein